MLYQKVGYASDKACITMNFPLISNPVPVIFNDRYNYPKGLGRLADLLIAVSAIIFFLPLMLIIMAMLAVLGGSVFFRQLRVGQAGVMFECLKFRTMRPGADRLLEMLLDQDPQARAEWSMTQKLRNDPRVDKFGLFLRRTSLDELPQFFNVLSGSMSIVGPRPIVPAEARRYGRHFMAYCKVRPGITGLWQISGRNDTTYRRRVACDVIYVRSRSTLTDLSIIGRTLPAVLLARGVY